jgi:hypothetical protein
MRYRLGDVRLVPPVITPKPKAVEPDKVVERPVASAAATPLLVKREFGPKSDVVVVPPDASQEVSDHPNRDERKGAKDKP